MVHGVFEAGFGPHDRAEVRAGNARDPASTNDSMKDEILLAVAPDTGATPRAVARCLRDTIVDRLTPRVDRLSNSLFSLSKCFPYMGRTVDLRPVPGTVNELEGDFSMSLSVFFATQDGKLHSYSEDAVVGENCYAVIEVKDFRKDGPFRRGVKDVASALGLRVKTTERRCQVCGLFPRAASGPVDDLIVRPPKRLGRQGRSSRTSSRTSFHHVESETCECGQGRAFRSPFCLVAYLVETPSAIMRNWVEWRTPQPLWAIRDYFGERVALYFAWVGSLVNHLQKLSILGVVVFLYGLYNLVTHAENGQGPTNFDVAVSKLFDNEASSFFGILVCFWAASFSERWKRRQATWAHRWDVSGFESEEEVRPQFRGEKVKSDPLTGDLVSYVPVFRLVKKLIVSYTLVTTMVIAVVASVVAVMSFRLWLTSFSGSGAVASIVPAILDTIRIIVLGKIYERIATQLTEYENHRTQTMFEDQLIVKLFLFQFINTYTTLFYISFVRSRISVFGQEDKCGAQDSCMSQLSVQVLIQLIAKPLADSFNQNVLPRLVARYRRWNGEVDATEETTKPAAQWVEIELQKEIAEGFTASGTVQQEYSTKVIVYGLVVLFAVAMPIAPFIFMSTLAADVRLDSVRIFSLDRRMHARRAEDIGMWERIISLMNYVAIISNAFLLAFTSSSGRNLFSGTNGSSGRLWFVITFEHACALLIFVLSALYLDVPREVRESVNIKAKAMLMQVQDARDWIKHPKTLWSIQKATLTNNDGVLLSRKVPDPMAYFHNFSELARSSLAQRWGPNMLAPLNGISNEPIEAGVSFERDIDCRDCTSI